MPDHVQRLTAPAIAARKGGEPIVCLTVYTAPMAHLYDPHVDLLLVGDSVGMVLYGMGSTLGVTLDMMIAHGQAVMRGTERACIIVDLPFGTYQESPERAFRSAARVMRETGCSGIKLEGGAEMAETVAFLAARGIPVLGHVGLTPQLVNSLGGYRARGRGDVETERLMADARAIAEAGAFATVVEGVMESIGRAMTEAISIPTIGIGASSACDGQILVTDDMLGLTTGRVPKFVRRYATLSESIDQAVATYAGDVRARRFPAAAELYGVKPA